MAGNSTGVPSGVSGKTFGMPSTFDVAARPRPGLGMKQDRPKTPQLEKGVSYAAPKIKPAASPYKAGSKIMTAGVHPVMPHKVNY